MSQKIKIWRVNFAIDIKVGIGLCRNPSEHCLWQKPSCQHRLHMYGVLCYALQGFE